MPERHQNAAGDVSLRPDYISPSDLRMLREWQQDPGYIEALLDWHEQDEREERKTELLEIVKSAKSREAELLYQARMLFGDRSASKRADALYQDALTAAREWQTAEKELAAIEKDDNR
ncbi:hypothetical protein GCM10022286_00590 [Gryllotalpicola daejeonensis]|uniref:Uncharacterized protein n=2 Tax=Gryllotalpicola daejeonensis TaxID=993087 RepID=A0ABP7ZCW4_9MICO